MNANATRHPPLDELSAWVDGEIGGEPERRVLAEHVASCPSCASLAADFRALAGAQVSATVPPVPPRLQARIFERLAGEGRFGRRPVRRYVVPLSAAATVLVGVVALWLVRHQPEQRAPAVVDAVQAPVPAPEPQSPSAESAPVPDAQDLLSRAPASPADARAPSAPLAAVAPGREEAARKNASEQVLEQKVAAKDKKDEVAGGTAYAPVPAPETPRPSQEPAVAGTVRQQPVAMKEVGWRWTRIQDSQDALSKRRDAAQEAAPAPEAEAGAGTAVRERDFHAMVSGTTGTCPVLDLLEPAPALPGMDQERGRQLAERARAAGAAMTSLEPGPRLTLIVPRTAWGQVWKALADEGVLPATAPPVPEGAGCLVVAIEGRP